MAATLEGYQLHEELHTEALTVIYRAAPEGEPAPGALALRLFRNPGGIIPAFAWKARCEARLASIQLQRIASEADPTRFAPIHASGRCAPGVYDVTDYAPLTAADLIARRALLTPRQLHRLVTGVLDACIAMETHAGRAHGALRPGRILIDTPAIEWSSAVRLIDPAPSVNPDGAERADLHALGELLYMLATHRESDMASAIGAGEAVGLAETPRRLAARWRRLCEDLLDAQRSGLTLEKAAVRVRGLKPASPAQARLRAGGVGAAAVVLVSAAGWYVVSREREVQLQAAQVPGEMLFLNLEAFARQWERAVREAPETTTLARAGADDSLRAAIDLLSTSKMLEEGQFQRWFSVPRARVTSVGADVRALIDWRRAPAQEWWDAQETLHEAVRTRFIEPLVALAQDANRYGWTRHSREAESLAAELKASNEAERLPQLLDRLRLASDAIDRLSAWNGEMRDAAALHAQAMAPLRDSRAVIPVPDAEPRPVGEVVEAWLLTLAQAQSQDEPPAETIQRYRDVGAVAIEEVVDAARYWDTTPEFEAEQFLAQTSGFALASIESAADARDALRAWKARVEDPMFLNIGADPRDALLAQREALDAEVQTLLASLDEDDRGMLGERVAQVRERLAAVEAAIAGLGAWSPQNERPIRDAAAAGLSRLAEAQDRWADAQNYLEERQNIEARREGVVGRALTLADEQSSWFGPLLQPRIEAARAAQGDEVSDRLDELDAEVQRFRAMARSHEAMELTVGRLEADARSVGPVLAARGRDLLQQYRAQAPTNQEVGAQIEDSVRRLAALRDELAGVQAAVESRTPLGAESGALATRVGEAITQLASFGVDPAAVAEQGRSFRLLTELRPYVEARGDWPRLRDRLAADLAAGTLRSESLWHAYAALRDAEPAAAPALAISDIELERQVRARLTTAFQTVEADLAAPPLASRLDTWMSARAGEWAGNADALRDAATARQMLAGAPVDTARASSLASGLLLEEILTYQLPEENDDAALTQIGAYRVRVSDLRASHAGASPWYRLLGALDDRLAALADTQSGPTLDEELLRQSGPGLRGWTLVEGQPVEQPVYERDDVRIAFTLIDSVEPPVFLARDELSLEAFEAVTQQADRAEWEAISAQTIFKTWGAEPDFQQLADRTRGYYIDDRRRVTLQGDWVAPFTTATAGGQVNWAEHWSLAYEDDAARASGWAPSMTSPLHMVGFAGAVAVANAAGCRLPTPDEWRAAIADTALREGDIPNVSDATWLAQMGRTSRTAAQPSRATFFAQATGEAPEPFTQDDDGWLWPRPVGANASAPLRDLVGNVAEWADARARQREGDFTLAAFTTQEIDDSARIMGVSALSASGAEDQEVPLRPRGRRTQGFADRTQAARGFADVGVRLAFDVGDVRPKSLAERYTEELADVVAAAQSPETQ